MRSLNSSRPLKIHSIVNCVYSFYIKFKIRKDVNCRRIKRAIYEYFKLVAEINPHFILDRKYTPTEINPQFTIKELRI